jgi:hypothetical protein
MLAGKFLLNRATEKLTVCGSGYNLNELSYDQKTGFTPKGKGAT